MTVVSSWASVENKRYFCSIQNCRHDRLTVREVANEVVGTSIGGTRRSNFIARIVLYEKCVRKISEKIANRGTSRWSVFGTKKSCSSRPKFYEINYYGRRNMGICGYDPETKCSIVATEVFFVGFFDLVHDELVLSTGQTVNRVFYTRVLERLREKVRRKRPKAYRRVFLSTREFF